MLQYLILSSAHDRPRLAVALLLVGAMNTTACAGNNCQPTQFHNPSICIPTGTVQHGQSLRWVAHDLCANDTSSAPSCDVSVVGTTVNLDLGEMQCSGVGGAECIDKFVVCVVPPLDYGTYSVTVDRLPFSSIVVADGGTASCDN